MIFGIAIYQFNLSTVWQQTSVGDLARDTGSLLSHESHPWERGNMRVHNEQLFGFRNYKADNKYNALNRRGAPTSGCFVIIRPAGCYGTQGALFLAEYKRVV